MKAHELIHDQFSGIETTSLRNSEVFPTMSAGAVTAFAPNNPNRTRYARSSTLTQFPGKDLAMGQQDTVSQEVIR